MLLFRFMDLSDHEQRRIAGRPDLLRFIEASGRATAEGKPPIQLLAPLDAARMGGLLAYMDATENPDETMTARLRASSTDGQFFSRDLPRFVSHANNTALPQPSVNSDPQHSAHEWRISPTTLPSAGRDRERCLDACASRGRAWENFCRSIKNSRVRAGCWATAKLSETACRNWCFWNTKD